MDYFGDLVIFLDSQCLEPLGFLGDSTFWLVCEYLLVQFHIRTPVRQMTSFVE